MSIFNNPAVKYNYEEGNGVTLSSCNEPTSTISNVIGSSTISQKNVEGLEERFVKTEESLHSNINLTLEHGQKIDELNKQNNKRVEEIVALENELTDVYWHIDQLYDKLYNQTLKFAKESMIMFFMIILLFVIDLAVLWLYIRK